MMIAQVSSSGGRLRKETHPIHDSIHPPLTYFKNLFNINNNSWSLCKTDSKRILKENRQAKPENKDKLYFDQIV